MKNAKLAVLIILPLVILMAQSGNSAERQGIRGTVYDAETLQPLSQANISVLSAKSMGTTSDANGHFELLHLPQQQLAIKVTVMGYKSSRKRVKVIEDSVLVVNFPLQPTVLLLDSVSVTDSRIRNVVAAPRTESPGLDLSISKVSQREIERQGAKTLVEAMKFVPGAFIETRGRKVKQFYSVRGQQYPYPEYAINGAWQREFHEMPYFFSSEEIERIEIIRSSAALLTGLSGMAGVINIVTREYERAETSQEIEYGSFGTVRAHLSHGAKIGNLAYATGIGFRHTDGPENKHAAENMADFYGSIKWQPLTKLKVKAHIFHLNGKRELALAEPPAQARFLTELAGYDPYRATLANVNAFYQATDKLSTEFLTYYAAREPIYFDEDPQTHELSRVSESDYEFGMNLIQSVALSEDNVLRFGGLYNRWIAPNGKRFYVGKSCDLSTYSAVIVDEHRFGAVSVDAGLRWIKTYIDEYGAFNIDGTAGFFRNVTPITDTWEPSMFQGSLGAAVALHSTLTLNANMAAGEIQPRRGTLDIDLKEPLNEKRIKGDFGLRFTRDDIGQISAVGFFTLQQDAIILTGQTMKAVDGRVLELYANQDQRQLGIEFDYRSTRLFNAMEAFFNVTAISSKAKMDGEYVHDTELPEVIGSGGVFFKRGALDVTLLAKYIAAFESTRFAADANQPVSLGDFVEMDFSAGWSFGKTHSTRLYLELANLTDDAYSTVVGYPDFGRRITLGLRKSYR
ncbi:TonB-dependent receptor [candidate division KSB1 bacterium]|nr:TonB-dependent receptor [candidate division KSB1 bacterium]